MLANIKDGAVQQLIRKLEKQKWHQHMTRWSWFATKGSFPPELQKRRTEML